MRVVMAASEMVPYAKTGGLADVMGALPRALRRRGIDVTVVMPKYEAITAQRFPLRRTEWLLSVPVSGQTVHAAVVQSELDDQVPVYLIEADRYFARPSLYGTPDGDYVDNAERFAFFGRAVLALIQRLGAPDLLHCHDWQTALAPVFLRIDPSRYPDLAGLRTMLTVHNFAYQGLFWHFDWHLLNLDWRYFTADWLEFYGRINYLKGGIICADAISTVSPTYAKEVQTPELGHGLDGVLKARRQALTGILNGVDYEEWSPEHDPHIAARYSAHDRSGKAACKADLQATLGLPVNSTVPVIGIVSRLVDQKGFDLITAIAPGLLRKRVQVVILGSGETAYQSRLLDLQHRFNKRLAVRIGFDNALAHRIEAGSDMFLMPSRYEPCGLNQMYSLRYGTIPIVHATGGLEDTIDEFDPRTGQGTGFKFAAYTADALMASIDRALRTYRNTTGWNTAIRNAMHADFSWDCSAEAYSDLYKRLSAGGSVPA